MIRPIIESFEESRMNRGIFIVAGEAERLAEWLGGSA